MVIRFEDVSFSYAGNDCDGLAPLNVTIADGECILLCGRSGSGKTTFTRLINGLIPNFYAGTLSGRVIVNDHVVAETPMYQLAEQVGSVFQNPRTQFFNTDTDSEIAFGCENGALPAEALHRRVAETEKVLQIEHLSGRSLFALSGGEKQKIAFASIYAMNPDIYLLDEPSSNLDMDAIAALKETIALLKAQGKTVLVAEHRLYYLMDVIDRAFYFEGGRLTQIFTPEALLALPADRRACMGLRAVDLRRETPAGVVTHAAGKTLTLRNFSLRYKKQRVLSQLNLSVHGGEVVAIVGHNGAGKTTFSRALCGLHKDQDGQVLVDGVVQSRRALMKQSYLVMQDVNYELFAESVAKESVFGIAHPDLALAEKTLEDLALAAYRDWHPNTLSGGQKQRLAVAVSMVCHKDLLVFDEPTSGLDLDNMLRVAALIHRLAQMGKIIFVATHDYEFVCRVCQRVLHLDGQHLVDDFAIAPENMEKLRRLFAAH